MSRPRTPTEVLELRGSFVKDPSRKRAVGPKSVAPIGPPPTRLDDEEKNCWLELQNNTPAGVLTKSDRWVMELACRLMAKLRTDWLNGAEFGALTRCLSSLGITPADRSRVGVVPDKSDAASPWEVIDGGKTQKSSA